MMDYIDPTQLKKVVEMLSQLTGVAFATFCLHVMNTFYQAYSASKTKKGMASMKGASSKLDGILDGIQELKECLGCNPDSNQSK